VKKTVILNSETMGQGDDRLGRVLTESFLRQLLAGSSKPQAIVFYNSAVNLLEEEHPVIDTLEALFRAGVDLIACGTCVSHFRLNNRIAVGRVSNMQEIVATLLDSDSVITI